MARPKDKDHTKSWVIKWKGNVPVLEPSVWQPGYTPGHQPTEPEAIAMEVAHLLKNIADFRQKWLNLILLAEKHKHEVAADAFGQLLTVTETDDPHEKMTMPEGAKDVPPSTYESADDRTDRAAQIREF